MQSSQLFASAPCRKLGSVESSIFQGFVERIVPSAGTLQKEERLRASNGLFVRAVLTQIALPAAGSITLCTQLG